MSLWRSSKSGLGKERAGEKKVGDKADEWGLEAVFESRFVLGNVGLEKKLHVITAAALWMAMVSLCASKRTTIPGEPIFVSPDRNHTTPVRVPTQHIPCKLRLCLISMCYIILACIPLTPALFVDHSDYLRAVDSPLLQNHHTVYTVQAIVFQKGSGLRTAILNKA